MADLLLLPAGVAQGDVEVVRKGQVKPIVIAGERRHGRNITGGWREGEREGQGRQRVARTGEVRSVEDCCPDRGGCTSQPVQNCECVAVLPALLAAAVSFAQLSSCALNHWFSFHLCHFPRCSCEPRGELCTVPR